MNAIIPTCFVTFPRSGHHWLEYMLSRYFGADWRYCESYNEPEKRMAVCPATNAEKTHDFALDFDPGPAQVIVQYRRDVGAAIRSLYVATHPAMTLEEFAASRTAYWLGFTAKWVNRDHYVVYYEDLLANPVETVRGVITRLAPAHGIESTRLLGAVSANIAWPLLGIGQRGAPQAWEGPAI